MEPTDRPRPRAIAREKNKVFRSMQPIQPTEVVRGHTGYLDEPDVRPDSRTETFIALRCFIDNWRWAGVPFYLRTGKRMAEVRGSSPSPSRSRVDVPTRLGRRRPWADHLTFILSRPAEDFALLHGKHPARAQLDKLSMQFSMQETSWARQCSGPTSDSSMTQPRGTALSSSAEGIEAPLGDQ